MKFRRCDRCGAEYEPHEAQYILTTETLGIPRNVNLRVNFPFDLCDKCHEDFVDWFRQPKMDKAMEEARAKAHAHENGEVTVIGLQDGRCICPVCGHVFETFVQNQYILSDGNSTTGITTFGSCPKCGALFNRGHITYTDDYGREDNNGRGKYICPECGGNLMGKPLMCATCGYEAKTSNKEKENNNEQQPDAEKT